jgi:hypothetical protein
VETTVLIVTDGAEGAQRTAKAIIEALGDRKVTLVTAGDFEGTQLLSAGIFFFGAEAPNPPSFAYLHKMLEHINLAGRPCGVFSSSERAAVYLCGMVHDSEAALYPEPFLGAGDIGTWVEKVVTRQIGKNP